MTTYNSGSDLAKAKIGIIAQSVGQIVIGLLGVLVVKIMTTSLGSRQYGIYATALALVSTFSLFTDLGVNTATLREIAKYPKKADEVISHNLGLRLTASLVIVPLVSVVGILFYPNASPGLRTGILLISFYLFFDAIWSTCVVYFGAKVRNDIVTAVVIIQQLLFVLFLAVAALTNQGLSMYILAYVCSYGMTALVAYFLTRQHISIRPALNLSVWRQTIHLSIALGAIDVLNQIYHVADSIMLSIFKGTYSVGIYAVAYSLVGIFLFLPDYVLGNLTPIIIKVRRRAKVKQLVKNSYDLLVCLGLLVPLIAYFLGKDMILMVSSKNYINAALPFFLLTLGVLFTYIATPFIRTSIALGKQQGLLSVTLSTLALNVLVNLYTIPHYGLVGAASATVVSEFFSAIAVIILFKRHARVEVNLLSALRPMAAASLTFLILLRIDTFWHTLSTELNLLIGLVAIVFIYALLLWVLRGVPTAATGELQSLVSKAARTKRKQ